MLTVIYNPVAGRGRAAAALPRVRAFLEDAGVAFTVLTSRRPGHVASLAAQLPQDATVVAMGGDGTVHEAAASCIGNARTLGVIPVGSGDDFAYALGIDRHDLAAALQRLVAGRCRKVDTGEANGRVFVNAASLGFDAAVARRVRQAPSMLHGLGAYLYGVATGLAGLRAVPVEVRVDGVVAYHGRSLLVSTHLGPRTGGSFLFAPAASVDDGLFEVVVAGALGRLGTMALLPRVMRGQHLGHPRILVLRGRHVRLRWAQPQPGHLDGEPLPDVATVDLHLCPASLRVLC